MAKINELVAQLGPGWTLVGGGVPVEELETIPNPAASNPTSPVGTPPTTQAGTGRYMVIVQDPQGHQRAMYLTAGAIKGGLVVPVTGQAPPKGTAVYTGDLTTIDWNPAGPVGDVPAGPAPKPPTTTSPSEITWIDGPAQEGQQPQQQGHRIIDGQLVPVPNLTRAKPADDRTGAPTWIPDQNDPTREVQVVISGTNALPVTANGVPVTRLKATTPGEGPTTAGGPRWIPHPTDPTQEVEVVTTVLNGTPTNKPTGATRPKPPVEPTAASNIVWQDIEGQPDRQQGGTVVNGKFVPTEGLTKEKNKPVAVYGTGPNDKLRIVLDDKGNVISQEKNPNYQEPPGTQLTPDTIAANIQILMPDGTVKSVPNTNRVTVGQAMADLMQQAGLKVNAGELSMDDAKNMLTSAVNLMNANTAKQTAQTAQETVVGNAAQNVLSNQQQQAQTASSALQARATNATNLVQQGLNVATSAGGRYGNYSGGMLSPVPGLGQNLVQGAAAFATEMGGGQAVFDTAVRMVQAADPNNQNPDRAQAVGALTQIMDRYKQATGQDYPTVAATKATAASGAAGGMAAPVTVAQPAAIPAPPPPTVFPAAVDPRFYPDMPQQPANTLLPAGVAGTVSADDPRRLRPRTAEELAGIGGFTAPALA